MTVVLRFRPSVQRFDGPLRFTTSVRKQSAWRSYYLRVVTHLELDWMTYTIINILCPFGESEAD